MRNEATLASTHALGKPEENFEKLTKFLWKKTPPKRELERGNLNGNERGSVGQTEKRTYGWTLNAIPPL
jgi:hypothetical protein